MTKKYQSVCMIKWICQSYQRSFLSKSDKTEKFGFPNMVQIQIQTIAHCVVHDNGIISHCARGRLLGGVLFIESINYLNIAFYVWFDDKLWLCFYISSTQIRIFKVKHCSVRFGLLFWEIVQIKIIHGFQSLASPL